MSGVTRTLLRGVRGLDRHFSRRSDQRRILVDARTPVNFTMVAPVYRALRTDPRNRRGSERFTTRRRASG
jgi:hypothetical protein